jgi:hypothetical protein
LITVPEELPFAIVIINEIHSNFLLIVLKPNSADFALKKILGADIAKIRRIRVSVFYKFGTLLHYNCNVIRVRMRFQD